jgi:hypothetical protein
MSYEQTDPKGLTRDVLAAADTLRDALSKVQKTDAGLDIGVSVGGAKDDSGSTGPTTSARLVITIDAESADHAYEHAKMLEDQGCVCTSSGETQVTCDCSNHSD